MPLPRAAGDTAAPPAPAPARAVAPAGAADTRLALVAILLAALLAALDTAIANTALPVIAADLRAQAATSVWVVNAYQLAVVATLLPCAALSDLIGPRRIYLCGLALFIAASAACALAPTLPALAAARVLQGLGGGALMSVNIALIRLVYPPQQLGRGVGLNALVVGVGFALGPSLSSLVLALASWPWLFWINVPLGLLALGCALPALPRVARAAGTAHGDRGFDRLGAMLAAAGFAAFFLALSTAAQREPWPLVLLALAVAVACTALLLRRQAGHPAPMLPVDLLRRPMFALSVATSVASFTTQGLAFVGLPFYFQQTLHRDAVATGLLMTPWPIIVALAAPIAGRLSDRHAPGLLGGAGLAMLSAGMASLAWLSLGSQGLPGQGGSASPSAFDIGWRMAVCGLGFGFFQSPNLRALMASAPPERSGGASGMIAVSRLTGQTSGAALVALCLGLAGSSRGPVWALALGAVCAALAACASAARHWAR